jgi:hypothetical protein
VKNAPKPRRDTGSSKRPDDPEQFKRFVDMAREVGVDESPEALDKAFEKVMGRQRKIETPSRVTRNRSPRKTK